MNDERWAAVTAHRLISHRSAWASDGGCAEQAELDGPDGRLGAVGDAELGDDVLDVHLDGAHADDEALGYLAVGLALGEQTQHLVLARREALRRARSPGAARLAREAA